MPATLDELLRELAARHGDRVAVAGADSRLSFAQLDAAAEAWARRLAPLEAAHVGLLAANGPEWLAAAFGVWRSGATLVPLSTFATPRELGEILAHADVEVLLAQRRMRSHDFEAALAAMPAPPRLRRTIFLDQVGEVGGSGGASAAQGAPPAAPRPESIACILYTSGTTGTPKGVMLSHRAILATVLPTASLTGLGESDLLLSTLPLFWVAGLVIRALPTLATGCGLLLPESFTAEGVVDLLGRERVTGIHLRPPQVGALLSHPRFEPRLLAEVRRGGGRVDWFEPHFDLERVRLITGYGMTETSGYVTALDWRDPPAVRRVGLGRPLPGVEIRIVAADGRPVEAGASGEIRVRGPGLFSGYYRQPPGTGLDEQGFLRTGDLGRVDADGTFHFDGRSKDLLRVKGINVSPVEVETVLGAHPGVEAVYVVGLPEGGQEQTVVALVVGGPQPPSEGELRARAQESLSHYKRPSRYLFIERGDVALGATSKPQRGALAALAARHLEET